MSDMFEKVAQMAGKTAQMEEKRAQVETDRENYAATLVYFRETGYWSEEEIAGYSFYVKRMMQSGTPEEKEASSEFWALKAAELQPSNSAKGINERIRARIAKERAEKQEAA